jgi:hypothetical protein
MPSWRNNTYCKAAPPANPEVVLDDSDPFPCEKCDKGFTSQRGLSMHLTVVHKDKDENE